MSLPYGGPSFGSNYSFNPNTFHAALDRERARNRNLEDQLRQARRANDVHWVRRLFRTVLTLVDPTGLIAAFGLELAFDYFMEWWDTRSW